MKNITADNKPLYQQVEAGIKDSIITKEYKPGEKLPTESEFAKEYNVSIITIRKAMELLTEQGLVEKIQGKGTFVIPQKENVKLGMGGGFDELFASKGHQTQHKILSTAILEADEFLASKLNISLGDEVSVIERLITEDYSPIAIDRVYVSNKLVPNLMFKLSEKKSLYQTLKDEYNIIPKTSSLLLNGISASVSLSKILDCSIGDPIFELEKVAYTENTNEVIHYSVSQIRCDRITYEFEVQ